MAEFIPLVSIIAVVTSVLDNLVYISENVQGIWQCVGR